MFLLDDIDDYTFRLEMGDEMSKRKKFIFVTWIGPDVSVIQRAKMSTDKAIIKDVLNVSSKISSRFCVHILHSHLPFKLEFCG